MSDIEVRTITQKIVVEPQTRTVRTVISGPQGPPGFGGISTEQLNLAIAVETDRAQTIESGLDSRLDLLETASSGSGVSKLAASTLSGHRVVYFKSDGVSCDYASNTTLEHMRLSVALTLGAATAGNSVAVLTFGEIIEPSWSWTPGAAVYLGVNGLLTATPPTSPAFLRVVGVAINATTIFFNPESPIILL